MKKIINVKKLSLSKGYFSLVALMLATILTLCGHYGFFTYKKYLCEKEEQVSIMAFNIQGEMNRIFSESDSLLHFLGEKIVNLGKPNPNFEDVYEILKNTQNLSIRSMASSYVSFADSNGKIVVTRKGVLTGKVPSICDRKYFGACKENPWTLQFSSITRSNFTNSPIIPMAMGINNEKRGFIGYLVLSIKIEMLNSIFNNIKNNSDIIFMVVDNFGNIIVKSSRLLNVNFALDKVLLMKPEDGFMSNALKNESLTLNYIKKVDHHSYYILTGVDEKAFKLKFFYQVLPSILQFTFMALFFSIILFFLRKMIINPATTLSRLAFMISKGEKNIKIPKPNSSEMYELSKGLLSIIRFVNKIQIYKKELEIANRKARESEEAKENFVNNINRELGTLLEEIVVYSKIVTESMRGNLDSFIPKKNMVFFLEKIHEASTCLQKKIANTLQFTPISIDSAIKECIKICENKASTKDIRVTCESKNLLNSPTHMDLFQDISTDILSSSFQRNKVDALKIWADELKFKQIITSLLFRSIQNSPRKSEIKIVLSIQESDGIRMNVIRIEDQGFGLSETAIQQIKENMGLEDENNFFELLILEKESIEKLINDHGGKFHSESILGEGSVITLLFPSLNEKVKFDSKTNNNVIPIRSTTE